jgi:hypothetical protein
MASVKAGVRICGQRCRSCCSGKLAAMPEKTPRPPDGLPTYRVLTGPDDAAFCHRVSEAVALGYKLYGSPALAYDGEHVIVGQALIWPAIEQSIASSK